MLSPSLRRTIVLWAVLLLGACRGGSGNGEPSPARFTLRLSSAPISAPRDSTGGLLVLVERQPDFTEPIELHVASPPAGIRADPVVVKVDDEARLPLHLGADLPLGPIELEVEGRAGDARATVVVPLDVQPEQPRSQQLIAAALAAGQLDLGTSLLYRAYAVFGDTRLPEAFVGSGPEEEDLALSRDLEAARSTLSANLLEQLQPFLVRPDDPKSVFNLNEPTGSQKRQALSDGEHCSGSTREWITTRSAKWPVRAWALCTGTHGGDEDAENALFRIISVVDVAWEPMAVRMGLGPAIPDLYLDDAIDVYAVPPQSYPRRERGDFSFEVLRVRGAAFGQPPYVGTTCSAYVMLPTWRMALGDYQLTLIHELFHVLQFAHNFSFDSWFYEASATWASMHVNRAVPIRPQDNAALHEERFGCFQKSPEGLLSRTGLHDYCAYIWPFFMEHEQGEAAIAQAWRRFENMTRGAQADEALNQIFSFKDNFHRFAIRNLNESLLPGNPVRPRHHERDTALPENALLPTKDPVELTGSTPVSRPVRLDPLAAKYFNLRVGIDSQVQRVEIDVSGLSGLEHLDVDALINNPDSWLSAPVSLTGEKPARFCFDLGPSTQERRGSFADLVLVLSNHSHVEGELVSGTLKVTPSKAGCAGWTGTIWWSQLTDTPGIVRSDVSTRADVTFKVDEDPPGGSTPGAVPYKVRSGTVSYHADLTFPTCHEIATANVEMSPDATTGEGATLASLTTFSTGQGVLRYGAVTGATIGTITVTGNCTADGSEETVSHPDSMIPWWISGTPFYDLKNDGTLMEEDLVYPGGTRNRWRLVKIEK